MSFRQLTNKVHHTVYPAISPSNPLNSAEGKTIIISGGSTGIGYGIAQSFVEAGAKTIVIIARRQEALDESSTKLRAEIAAAGKKTTLWTYLFDTTDQAKAEATFDDIRSRLNEGDSPDAAPIEPDVLITSAANCPSGESTLAYSPQVYRDAFETNFFGNMNLTRAFLKHDIPAIPVTNVNGVAKVTVPSRHPHHPKVILDVSTVATYAILGAQTPYGSSKLSYTRALQHLQAEVDGLPGAPIRIHSFHPGLVHTPASSVLFPEKVDAMPWDDSSLPGGFSVWLSTPAAAFLKGRFLFSNWDVQELMALKGRYGEDPEFGTITLKY